MKTKINHLMLLGFFALLGFMGCQDEASDIDSPDEQETIQLSSQLAQLMSRTTANFGGMDNVLDDTSCFSIALPVTIIVSDITIVIETEDDLEELEDLFDDIEDDEDVFDFVFPITIIFSDYTEIVIENEEQLEAFIEACDDEDEEIIECVDFVYPISFSVFNSEFNLIETITIESDEALYEFLDDLDDDENALIVSLNYPVSLEYANGEIVQVNSNEELVDAIELAEDDCDDDEDECDEEEVAELLLECPWDINDEGEDFENYQIVFYENGDLQILEDDTTAAIGGLWSLSTSDEGLILNLSDLTAFQDDLGGAWVIVDCDDELEIVRGNNEMELEQNCDLYEEEVFDCFDDFELVECVGANGEAQFNLSADTIGLIDCEYGFVPSFHITEADAEADIAAISETESYWSTSGEVYLRIEAENGDFEIFTIYLNTEECSYFECFDDVEVEVCDQEDGVEDGFGVFNLDIIFSDCPNDDVVYTFHESIVDAENNSLPLGSPYINVITYEQTIYARISLAGDPSIFEIFEVELEVEDCDENNCSEEDVEDNLTECLWNAVNYNGSDNLMDWNFSFEENSQIVVIYTDTQTIDATWATSQSSEGVLLTFSNVAGPNIQAITGEWLVVECEEDRLELHREDDVLVLEQNCD